MATKSPAGREATSASRRPHKVWNITSQSRTCSLRVGTLSGILAEVAGYLKRDRADLADELFGK